MRSFSPLVVATSLATAVLTSCSGSELTGPDPAPPIAPPPSRQSISVTPRTDSIPVGTTRQLSVTFTDRDGSSRPATAQWASMDPALATVNGSGIVSAIAAGTARIVATVGALSDTATIVGTQAISTLSIEPSIVSLALGDSLRLAASISTPTGGSSAALLVTWQSADTSIATVSPEGVVTTRGVGDVQLTASVGGRNAIAAVRVTPNPVAVVLVAPANNSILPGQSVRLEATLLDANGRVVTGRSVDWSSSNPSVANVNGSGVVKGNARGGAIITARVDGKKGEASFTVGAPPATSVEVSLSRSPISVGQVAKATATLRDASGAIITEPRTVAWQSSNPALAVVDADGNVTGIAPGQVTISAIADAKIGGAPIVVERTTSASISVQPAAASLVVGQLLQLSADVRDASGTPLTGRAPAWTSSNGAVATVSSAGLVTAIAPGTATITATVDGKTATAVVTVAAPVAPVASVAVTLNSSVLEVGQSTQAVAVLRDASGNALSGRAIQWASSDSTLASVTPSGLVTARAAGTVTVIASSEGTSGFVTATVAPPAASPVASVTLAASPTTLAPSQTSQVTVVLRDAAGTTLSGRQIVWSTANASVATVSAAGLVTAVGAGSATVTATSEGKSGTLTFTVDPPVVQPAPVATVVATLSATSIVVGQTTQASAVLRDAQGNALTGRKIDWSSQTSNVASVSSSGVVTALTAGATDIIATSEGKADTVRLSVTAPPPAVAKVTVSLASQSLTVGQTTQATATATSASGAVISGRPVVWTVSSGAAVASISNTGLVSAIGAGATTVTATIDGVTGSATLTVTDPAPPPPASTVAELPRVFLNTTLVAPTGATINVPAGGDLQGAIDRAQPGDVILLAPGATYTGPFSLPAKNGASSSRWVTIRTATADAQLPTPGQRMSASRAASLALPKLVGGAANASVLTTSPGAAYYRLIGLEITTAPGVTSLNALVRVGDPYQTTLTNVAHDIVLDRLYIHGTQTVDLLRCVMLNSAATAVIDSHLSDCHAKGADSQAIAGWNGPGPYKIVNNYLEGAGENILFGGSDPSVPNLVPSDIEMRGNHIAKPASWKGVWLVKNLINFKNVRRVLIEGNVFDGNWADGQTGYAFNLKAENQSGTAPWSTTQDVTIRYNRIRNIGAGFSIAGVNGSNPVNDRAARLVITDNIVEQVNVGSYTGDGWLIKALAGARDVVIERNTMVSSAGALSGLLLLDQAPALSGTVVRDNILMRGSYGAKGGGTAEGTASLTAFTPGYTWSGNILVGPSSSAYPAGTRFAADLGAAQALGGAGAGADGARVDAATRNAIVP